MLGLASEMQVEWQWLKPFSENMLYLKRHVNEVESLLSDLTVNLESTVNDKNKNALADALAKVKMCREHVVTQQINLEQHSTSISNLSDRLYHQTVASRMQPFSEGTAGLSRMVRDLARELGKQAHLKILGQDIDVDRDILEKLKSPLDHLLRNAIDHGLETPEERLRYGKREAGTIRLEAMHQAGMLKIMVSDDGGGIDLEVLRQSVVDKGHANAEMAERMTEPELMAFLFLPKFTMKEEVTQISGRGVGLDIVASMVRDIRGVITSSTQQGRGTRFELSLPITLSLISALLVKISGEVYAFPVVHLDRTLLCSAQDIEQVEGHQYLTLDGQQIGLVSACDVLGLPQVVHENDMYHVVVFGPPESRYGLIVDAFVGERNLVEKPMHHLLGKVQDFSSTAVLDDGSPLLIFDVNDLILSISKRVSVGKLGQGAAVRLGKKTVNKRILVVDDSLTVREVERKLLVAHGYEVEVAVDGVDGWNSVRASQFDLVLSDVDMPRMDGIELVLQIKRDAKLKDIPVVIVSYKESHEDRMRGLDAGADAYLTKSSFHDETLLDTVANLIGKAE